MADSTSDNEKGSNSTSASGVERRIVENKQMKLDDWKLVRVIGTGTFGKVYLGILNG